MRSRLLLCTGAASLFLASACSPDSAGSVGLTKDAAGHLVAVVVVCRGYIDGLTLYRDDTKDSDSRRNDRGKWESPVPIKHQATVDLTAPSNGWEMKTPLAPLRPGQEVRLYGWTKSSKWSADGPAFYPEDLARLDSDHVLFAPSIEDEKKADHGLVAQARFRELACH